MFDFSVAAHQKPNNVQITMHNYMEDDQIYEHHHPTPFHSRLVELKNENDIPDIIEFITPLPNDDVRMNFMRSNSL